MRCVAAAIFNEFGEPIGGVSVSGPTVRVTPERLAEIGPLVRDAAAEVTQDDRRRQADLTKPPTSALLADTSKTSSRIASPTPQAVRMMPAMKMRLARS